VTQTWLYDSKVSQYKISYIKVCRTRPRW